MYKLADDLALIQTVDYFTPIVDDPRIFGRVAAANSLSDVYAMGGRPITALNVICFPVKKLGIEVLREILEGGMEVLKEAQVALVGGHSVEDNEPKYGLSVCGLVHPDRIMTNAALRGGDRLILTKAVGTGLIATALKGSLASQRSVDAMVQSMCTINRNASEVAARFGVRACTDVTGFGLGGHMLEMARASRCRIRIDSSAVPLLEAAMEAASMCLVPGGTHANRKFFGEWTSVGQQVSGETMDLMFDPQTSGGLLLGVRPELADELLAALKVAGVDPAAQIGEVVSADTEGWLEIT